MSKITESARGSECQVRIPDKKPAKVYFDMVFGRLTVVGFYGIRKRRKTWICLCSCGKQTIASTTALLCGVKKSCGCLAVEGIILRSKTHGLTGTKIYKIWEGMIDRCHNYKNKDYTNYGERGIRVCARWFSLENFLEDMGFPQNGKSLDRKDNNLGYYKGNCRWATPKEQSQNKSSSKIWEINGIKFGSCQDAAEYFGVTRYIISKWCASQEKDALCKMRYNI